MIVITGLNLYNTVEMQYVDPLEAEIVSAILHNAQCSGGLIDHLRNNVGDIVPRTGSFDC